MNEFLDLHALADGELSVEQATGLKQRVQSDASLRREHEAILNLKDLVRDKSLKYESDECWKACVGRLNELDRSRKVNSFVSRYAWAFCGVLFAAIVGARFFVKDVRGDSVRAADIGRIFPIQGNPHAPVTPSQMQEYASLLNLAKQAVDPNALHLVCPPHQALMGDISITRLDLQDGHSGVLELYLVPAQVNFEDTQPLGSDPSVSAGVIAGNGTSLNCLVWSSDGRTLVLAGDRQEADLEQVRTELVGH
jgi:hypothetical protein